MSDVHHLLAKYLDALPAGYPPTEDGGGNTHPPEAV